MNKAAKLTQAELDLWNRREAEELLRLEGEFKHGIFFRDYEPEQAYGKYYDIREHLRYGEIEDY